MKKQKSKLFTLVDADERRDYRVLIRFKRQEHETILHEAAVRHVTVSDFLRSRALGQRCDVRFEVDCILQISDAVLAIRKMHKALVENGIAPPEEHMGKLINSATDAITKLGA